MKIALFKKQATSFWKSCQSITANLEAAYQRLGETENFKVEVFEINEPASYQELYYLSQRIIEGNFSHVSWIDHYPHPHDFLKAYFQIQPDKKKAPKFIFHLFGDFILQLPQWQALESTLEGVSLSLISASHRQNDLVNSLLGDDADIYTDTLAFPVNENIFSFDEGKRKKRRSDLEIKDDEKSFLYTGRLSYQKNIFDLIRSFVSYRKNFDQKAKLFLCGPMDDLGIPYLGKEALAGTFYFHWEECFRDPEFKNLLDSKVIQYLGNISTEELHETYCAADLYVSFSCHNDEDYGMSPAEASVCGLPSLLSSWGGFASFHKYFPQNVSLVPVLLNENRQAPIQVACIKALASIAEKKVSIEERKDFSSKAVKELGINSSSLKIKNVLDQLEKQCSDKLLFNETFHKVCSQLKGNKQAPFKGPAGGYSLFYRQVYRVYTGEGE